MVRKWGVVLWVGQGRKGCEAKRKKSPRGESNRGPPLVMLFLLCLPAASNSNNRDLETRWAPRSVRTEVSMQVLERVLPKHRDFGDPRRFCTSSMSTYKRACSSQPGLVLSPNARPLTARGVLTTQSSSHPSSHRLHANHYGRCCRSTCFESGLTSRGGSSRS